MPEKMDTNLIMSVFRHLVRVSALFRAFKDVITAKCFQQSKSIYFGEDWGELPLLLIWQGLKLYYAEQEVDQAPSKEMLIHYIREYIRRENIFTEERLQYSLFDDTNPETGYIAYIYADPCDCNMVSGVPLIQSFLRERVVTGSLSKMLLDETTSSAQFTDKLTNISNQAQNIEALGYSYNTDVLYPEQEYYQRLPNAPTIFSTGISWINETLGGGQRKGDCYSLLGGTGSGKTTLMIQMAVESAKLSARESTGEPDKVLYYTFEQCADDLKPRFTSCGASIHRDTCHIGNDSVEGLIAPSMSVETCKPYELERWPNREERTCEWDRYQQFKEEVNRTLFLRNFSGVSDYGDTDQLRRIKSKIGRRGVEEVYEDAKRIMDHFGTGIRTLFIDYAGVLCDRAAGYDTDKYFELMRGLGDKLRMDLAGKLDCTVIVAHQLRSEFNSYPPTRMPTAADSAGCKGLANDMPTCWVMGTPDLLTKPNGGGPCVYFKAAKQRYAGITAASNGLILQHDKYFARLNNVTSQFQADRATRTFVMRETSEVSPY